MVRVVRLDVSSSSTMPTLKPSWAATGLAADDDLSIGFAGETLSVSNGACSTAAARGAVARGGKSLAARCGTGPLAVSVGGATPSVAPDEPTFLFADGVGLTAAARGGVLGAAIGGQTLLAAAGDAAPSFDGGGASESGGDGDV